MPRTIYLPGQTFGVDLSVTANEDGSHSVLVTGRLATVVGSLLNHTLIQEIINDAEEANKKVLSDGNGKQPS